MLDQGGVPRRLLLEIPGLFVSATAILCFGRETRVLSGCCSGLVARFIV